MTSMKSPKVNKIAGRLASTKMGLRMALMMASTSPAMRTAPNLLPYETLLDKRPAAIHSPKLQTTQRSSNR